MNPELITVPWQMFAQLVSIAKLGTDPLNMAARRQLVAEAEALALAPEPVHEAAPVPTYREQ